MPPDNEELEYLREQNRDLQWAAGLGNQLQNSIDYAYELERELAQIKAQNERLESENRQLKDKLARAKNPEPVERPSLERCQRMAGDACMSIEKCDRGWRFRMGWQVCRRIFRKLRDVWEFLLKEEWEMSELGGFAYPDQTQPKPERQRIKPQLPRRNPSILPPLHAYPPEFVEHLLNRTPIKQQC